MASRFRQLVESVVFAGMKPSMPAAPSQSGGIRWLGPLHKPVERLLSGGPAPSDPLYLTRRTIGQKTKMALLVGIPCIILSGLMAVALSKRFVKKTEMPRDLTNAEIAKKMLPNLEQVRITTNRDVDVMEVRVDRTKGTALTGTVMNNTPHRIEAAEIVFDLTDSTGTQLGGVSQKLENLPPKIRKNFRLPIVQNTASFVVVREVKTW